MDAGHSSLQTAERGADIGRRSEPLSGAHLPPASYRSGSVMLSRHSADACRLSPCALAQKVSDDFFRMPQHPHRRQIIATQRQS
jgi:hypothetical protein